MNPTILTFLIIGAYLAVAALIWRPLARRIYADERREALHSSWKRETWNAARVRRNAGLAAFAFVLFWPIALLLLGLAVVVPPLYRRVMDKATSGIGDADLEPKPAEGHDSSDPSKAFDGLDPVDAAVLAWTVPAGSRFNHDISRKEVADAMPALARALDRLTEEGPHTST
jgi:hypothetical protein